MCRDKKGGAQFKITGQGERDSSEDEAYWHKYMVVIPDESERLWDALLEGMEKYRSVRQTV